jgi:hypothetical protein
MNKFRFKQFFVIVEKQQNVKKDNKYLIGMELRETERNYVTMLSNIIRVRYETRYTKFLNLDNSDNVIIMIVMTNC